MESFKENGHGTNVIKRDIKNGAMELTPSQESGLVNDTNNNRGGNCLKRGAESFCGSSKKWILLRFGMIFLISVVILCCVYGLKSTTKHKNSSNAVDSAYAVGDNVYAGDLWLVIELESNGRGLRTALGKAVAAHVCSAIKASQAVGWTPLVVGGKSICCRSSSCRHLHPQDLKLMKYHTTTYFIEKDDFSSAMKAAAFLAAIKRGARFIFHANPEVYYKAGVTPEQYQQQLEYQLKKTTLGVSVGLVKGRELETLNYFNPYIHFVPSLLNGTEKDSNRYKICETRPPSIEKFLDTDGMSMDLSAPPLTLPGKISSPFDSRNTAFARNAFWSLLVLPDIKSPRTTRSENDRTIYTFRSILAQTILSETGGSTKFSASQVATIDDLTNNSMEDMTLLISFLNTWKCPVAVPTAVSCFKDLGKALAARNILSKANVDIIDLWVTDLMNTGYEDVPALVENLDPLYPCVGQDALVGVYFYPSVIEAKRRPAQTTSFNQESRHPKSPSRRLASQSNHAVRMVQRLCPSVDVGYLSSTLSSKFYKHENLVLIVTFSDKQYHNLPLMEVLYRHHFKNMLYCGEPDESLENYREYFSSKQGGSFSFLPAHRHASYECLLGALEMGYNVDGFLIVDQNTLINSWNFQGLDTGTIWHGNEHVQNITASNIRTIDPEEKVIMKSTVGILKALQFLEKVLLSARNTTSPVAAPSTAHAAKGGDVSNLVAIKHSFFKRQAEFDNGTEAAIENGDIETATEAILEPEPDQPRDDILFPSDEEEAENSVEDQDYSEEEINIASQIEEDLIQMDVSGDTNSTVDVASIISDPVESPSIIEELEKEVVPQKQDFKISLFGELTKDESDEVNSDDEPVVGLSEDEEVPPVTIPPIIVIADIEEEMEAGDMSNQTAAVVPSTDNHANELLFHPANFVNVDENENAEPSTEPPETDSNLSETSDEVEVDDFTSMMYDIERLYKNINEKLNLWIHLKKYQSSMTSEEIAEVKLALDNLQCDVSTNTEICNLVATFFKVLQSNEGETFQLFYDDLPVYYVPAIYKDKLYLMANLLTKFNVADELAFPLLFRGLSHTSTWTKLTFAQMINATSVNVPNTPQDFWLLSDALEAHNQELNDLEAAHYLYPVDMKSVLTNEALRNVICRNF